MGSADLQKAFDYIKSHPEINEVILSGGDPLILSDQKLQLILESLDQIEHIRVIRFHTRILSAAAHRISSAFLKILSGLQKQIWFVVHLNVAEEMNPPFLLAAKALQKQGVILVSQSVLLKQINAQSEDLVRLFEGLYQIGIKPYYLHYPDLTPGTNHFRIPLTQAIAILKRVSVQLSGIAMPDFIVDIPRGMGKIRLSQFQASHIKTTEKKSQDDLQVYQEHWVFESPLTGEKKEVVYPFC
jgi:lysine 2,3-aminomutase